MGTANTQISTYSNVANKRIHNGFSATYATTATKCVIKSNLEAVEFLEAKDRTTTNNIYYATNPDFGVGSEWNTLTVQCTGSNYVTQPITYTNIYYTTATYDYSSLAYCSIRMPATIAVYSPVTVGLGCSWPDSTVYAGKCAIFAKQITGLNTGFVNLKYTLSFEGICGNSPTTSSSSGDPGIYGITNSAITYGIMITDSNGQLIVQETPMTENSNSVTNNITFSTSTSTINVYIIIQSASFTFIAGRAATYAGFKIKATSEVISYASRYDLDTKCVQYQDIKHPTGKQFTIYYGVWNNRGSNARLNNLYVQIKKTTDSSWTTIGTAALPSSLNKSTTGSVTCTLPTTYDPTVQYDFRVTAGQTNANQKWYYRWGSQSSLTASGYSWTYYGKVQTGACTNAVGLNTDSPYSTLRNYYFSSSNLSRGRSASQAALFCIE